jgi:N-methylhydantoinase A/oxoprolinase/acetone carboxylase beta subunit
VRVGVDTGGTFTDVVAADGRVVKVLSTPSDPSGAVASGVAAVGRGADGGVADGGFSELAHGTTVATNALLERTGARVALVTTEGFADLIEIARQDRPSLYDAWADRPEPLVPRRLRLEVRERMAADGVPVVAPGALPDIPPEVGAVAVCLLHADVNPAHEREVARDLRARGLDVTVSSELAPEFREYERLSTTVVNAYLRPACGPYLLSLAGMADRVEVLTSAGGLVRLDEAADRPAALLLSGPAGGVLAASAAAVAAGFGDAVTFDMGGTSTDVCLVRDGRPAPAAERSVAGLPLRLPALDVHTIGAGGGSIAAIDAGGALVVGPRSAGAVPGPACYGRGGTQPTVTDADVAAGRIPAGATLPGIGRLSAELAAAALGRLDPLGVIAVVDAAMVEAVRAVTVRRGVDPTALALVAFGGAGPLHACAVAGALGMRAVVVPPRAGVLSAVGLLGAPRQVDLVRSWPAGGSDVGAAARALAEEARAEAGTGAVVTTVVDCRYAGQGHELTVADVGSFEDEHERVNGYRRPGTPIEVVAIRATARVAPPPLAFGPVAPVRRPVRGPAAVAEPDCAVWVPAGWSATVHDSGAWVLTRDGG